jgi:hypothetical protein
MMPDAPRSDRLSRDELVQLQRRAIREWTESPWYAVHDPVGWSALAEQDPERICVDLGSGSGEAMQCPGHIAVDRDRADPEHLRERGETRQPDLPWDLQDGLPFEDQTVDKVHLAGTVSALSQLARHRLPQELARTVRVGGAVHVHDVAPVVRALGRDLVAAGFEEDELGPDADRRLWLVGRYTLTAQQRPLEDIQPHRLEEHVLGTPMVREVRMPSRR